MRTATKLIRVAQDPDSTFAAVTNPIWQTSTFAWKDVDSQPPFDYTRVSNPNRSTLEAILASLENGEHAVAFASGMAAITAAFSLLKTGDHLLVAGDIYGGTFRLAEKILPRQGIEVDTFDANKLESIDRLTKPNTRMLIFESPSNPTLRVADIGAISAAAKARRILSVFDNTFGTPLLQRPLDLGVDIVVHSTTKYLSGHSDIIGGALITNEDQIGEWSFEYAKSVGASPSPFDCWLTVRGLKTLGARMAIHNQNAHRVAEFLAQDRRVDRVHYPGLGSHPDHATAKKQMQGGFGGMVSFEVNGDAEQAKIVARSTRIFILAESLGGVESLVGYPSCMSHGAMTEEQRLQRGVKPQLLRLSVGIEDAADLIEDLEQALSAAF